MPSRRHAYTLLEILTVIGIISLLAAILLPAFNMARGSARRSSCASNLRQLGMALEAYTGDYDRFPRGLDFADKVTPEIWDSRTDVTRTLLDETPYLPDTMEPYVKSRQLWSCPSDIGLDEVEINNIPIDGRPSCSSQFGMSYLYRTELTILDLLRDTPPQPEKTNVLSDAAGDWHGAPFRYGEAARRYNVLFADGHVKNVDWPAYLACWETPLQP